jgi:hypothetical protein
VRRRLVSPFTDEEAQVGYRARWLAVKGVKRPALLEALGLEQASETQEAVVDPGLYAVALPNGWQVVIGDGSDAMVAVQPRHAMQLSAGTDALHFFCDDTTMFASLIAFRDGAQRWSLVHSTPKGRGAAAVVGALPPVAKKIIAGLSAERASGSDWDDVDHLYDGAAQIGRALTGFRHDETLGDGECGPIAVLRREVQKKRGSASRAGATPGGGAGLRSVTEARPRLALVAEGKAPAQGRAPRRR